MATSARNSRRKHATTAWPKVPNSTGAGFNDDDTHHDDDCGNAGRRREKQLLQGRERNRERLPVRLRWEKEIPVNQIPGNHGVWTGADVSLSRADLQYDSGDHDAQHHEGCKWGNETDVASDDRYQHGQSSEAMSVSP